MLCTLEVPYTALTVAESVPPYASLPAATTPFPAEPTAAPFAAAYTPAAPLTAAFAPLASPAGTWTLRVVDLGNGRERCVRPVWARGAVQRC